MEPGLPDELLLLALDDEKGSVIPAAAPALNGALVGAIMMELALQGRIHEGTDRRLVADPTPTGDEILDDVSGRISEANNLHKAHSWVARLGTDLPKLKDRLMGRLAAAGILELRHGRVWWVFPSRNYPLADGVVERQARDRIRAVVLDGESCDSRTAALLSLVQACNLLDELFTSDERPRARRRIVELVTSGPGEDATFDSRRETAAILGLGGATRHYTNDRLSQSGVMRDPYWDIHTYQPWVSTWSDNSSDDRWPSSTWDDRAEVSTASTSSESSTVGSSIGTWSTSPWVDDSGSAGSGSSEGESSSGGWSSGWSDGSSDSSSSDGGWDSGSRESDSSSDSGSSGC